MKANIFITLVVLSLVIGQAASAFEGRITAALRRGGQTTPLLYTAGTNFLRVEVTANNRLNPVNILDLKSGEMTLLFPNNRSFVRLKPVAENLAAMPPGFPQMPDMPAMPPGVGPQTQSSSSPPGNIGPTNLQGMPEMPAMPNMPAPPSMQVMPNMPAGGGMPAMPSMPMMRPPMMEQMELKATGEKTNLLGFACEQYEIKQRGGTMEIWATDQLFPFQQYLQNQPHRFGPHMIEQQWAEMVKARKLFPLLATLKFDNGAERYHFEVKSVTPQKLTDDDAQLFQTPSGWFEIQPLPF